MQQGINLKELERKAWRSVFQDGLWDIYLGLLLMAMAVNVLLSKAGLPEGRLMLIYLGLVVLIMLAMWAGKRFITVPRMGRVKFGPRRRGKIKVVRVLLAISVLVGALVFLGTLLGKNSQGGLLDVKFVLPVIWMANTLGLFSLGAYFLDFRRLYLIGVMYAMSVPLDFWVKELAGIRLGFFAFAAPAAVIMVVGLVVFVRFLRDYPLPAETSPPGEGAFHGRQ